MTVLDVDEDVSDLDHPGLRLITCAGGRDALTRRYLDNTAVFASFVSANPTAA